jgi:PAS domain S-box-containing protein
MKGTGTRKKTAEKVRKTRQRLARHRPKRLGKDHESCATVSELLGLATEFAHIGTVSDTPGQNFVRNQEHDRIYGVEPGSFFDENVLYDFVHPDDREFVKREFQETTSGKKPEFNLEHRIIRKDGVARWIHVRGRSHWDSKIKKFVLTGAVIDITEKKELEANRELFVSALSHDLRNPLAGVLTHAELLRRYSDISEDSKSSLNRIIINIHRADRMIQNLLDVTRVRSGEKSLLARMDCDLMSELEDSVREFTYRFGDRFHFVANGDFYGSWACQDIRRIVENLLENAVKYGGPDKPVTITLSKPNEIEILLSVKNEGNPIPPEEQTNILAPFRRTGLAEGGKAKGWGLGLAVVRSFVEAVGGRLLLQSSESTGTIFSIQIPITVP